MWGISGLKFGFRLYLISEGERDSQSSLAGRLSMDSFEYSHLYESPFQPFRRVMKMFWLLEPQLRWRDPAKFGLVLMVLETSRGFSGYDPTNPRYQQSRYWSSSDYPGGGAVETFSPFFLIKALMACFLRSCLLAFCGSHTTVFRSDWSHYLTLGGVVGVDRFPPNVSVPGA